MKKRLLSIALALCMCLSLLPTAASAESELTEITEIELTGFAEPAYGTHPKFQMNVPEDAPYYLAAGWEISLMPGHGDLGEHMINGIAWKYHNLYMETTDLFDSKFTECYEMQVILLPRFDYKFAANPTVTINGKSDFFTVTSYGSELQIVTDRFTVEDPKPDEVIPISSATISNIKLPAYSEHPGFDPVVPEGAPYRFATREELAAAGYPDADLSYNGVWWRRTREYMKPNDVFLDENQFRYWASMVLVPEEGYVFEPDPYVNGGELDGELNMVESHGDYLYIETMHMMFQYPESPDTMLEEVFRVRNGTWADGSYDDISVLIDLTDGKGTLDPASVPTGMKPAPGYENGAWDQPIITSEGGTDRAHYYTYRFTLKEDLIPISEVAVNGFTQPVYGESPEFALTVPEGAPYHFASREELNALRYKDIDTAVNGVWWLDHDGYMTPADSFDAVSPYRAKMVLIPNDGYVFDEDLTVTIDGGASVLSAVPNGTSLTVETDELTITPPAEDTVSVTFRIEHGTWADNTTADRTVSVPLSHGYGSLRPDQIPAGMHSDIPGAVGTWKPEPNTAENGIIDDVTYTYTFICPIQDVLVTDLTRPVDGGTPNFALNVPEGAPYRFASKDETEGAWFSPTFTDMIVNGVMWYYRSCPMTQTDIFFDGQENAYFCELVLVADEGYEFAENATVAIDGCGVRWVTRLAPDRILVTSEPMQLTHVGMEHHPGQPSSCMEAGTKEHWHCSACNRNFMDEAGAHEITDLTIPAVGHHFWDNKTYYDWSEDGKTCTAQIPCLVDPTHAQLCDAVVTSEITKPATETEMGETTYTAAFDVDWAEPQTLVLTDIPIIEHPEYAITFNPNGGTVNPTGATALDGILTELPVPTREGYRFLGWFQGGTEPVEVTLDTVFTGDTEIYAQWERTYTVTFDPLLGEAEFLSAQTVGDRLTMLPDCQKPGYIFVGWFDQVAGGTQVTPDQVYTADTTLYARWKVENPMPYEYPVTFHANDAETEVMVPMNDTIGDRMPADPVREGYRFLGWNTAPDGSGDPVTADTFVDYYVDAYAQWEKLPTARIVVQFTHTFFAGFEKVDTFVLGPGQSMTAPGAKLFGPAKPVTWTSADGSLSIPTGETLRYEDAVKLLGGNVTEGTVVRFVS